MTAGPAVGRRILVEGELRLGSAEQGDGALGGDCSLSGAHALLERHHDGDWMVRDLGSERGTFLNGQPLASVEPLRRGDTLRLGDTRLLVVEGAARAQVELPAGLPERWQRGDESPPPDSPAIAAFAARPLADRIAPYKTRALAALIDGVIATAIVVTVVLALGRALFSTLAAVAVVLCWDFLFESLRGQTIGKRAMKVRVVRRDGAPLRPQHVAARNVLRLLDGLPGAPLVGILSMIASGPTRRQRLGDLAGGTIVVKSGRAMSKLPASGRDRLVLAAYPVLWLGPVIAWALTTPGATASYCRTEIFSPQPPEKSCLIALPPDGHKALLDPVNAGHTLHWQGANVRLLATRAHRLRRGSGRATVVALKLAVTNATGNALRFDQRTVRMVLNVPLGGGAVWSTPDLRSSIHVHGFRALGGSHALAPAATRTGWARFAVPSGAVAAINATLASISFFPVTPTAAIPEVGNIRLWSPATARGAAAVHLRVV